MKTMNIVGVTFEVTKDSDSVLNPWWGFLDIYDAYNMPSDTKCAIYDSWVDFFFTLPDDYEVVNYGVISHNCSFFTFGAIIKHEGETYNVIITRAHNRISKVAH